MALIDDVVAHHQGATERYEIARQIIANARRRFARAEAQDATVRYCPSCDEVKLTSLFGRDSSRSDGIAVYCRPCRRM